LRFSFQAAIVIVLAAGTGAAQMPFPFPRFPRGVKTVENQSRPATLVPAAARAEVKSFAVPPRQGAMLSKEDGFSVMSAALQKRKRRGKKPDCSHLVNDIYKRVGFEYEYARSSDLYLGVKEFKRVGKPQQGDLVVWPGHVGIVVNPSEKSFYSSLRSGLGVENYDEPAWKKRGKPRFYRYVKAPIAPLAPGAVNVADSTPRPVVPKPKSGKPVRDLASESARATLEEVSTNSPAADAAKAAPKPKPVPANKIVFPAATPVRPPEKGSDGPEE
jgi:NlpC/P60 family protein